MFDKGRLREALVKYKANFDAIWQTEKYKWEAVQCFQDNWDIGATDFAEMLSRSLAKTGNLLTSANNFPKSMIKGFATDAPEEVRAMFAALFDENADIYERIKTFKARSSDLLAQYGKGARSHYQTENPISVYLWLKYPDKYYIYKFGEVQAVSDFLQCDYQFKKGAYAENVRKFHALYDEICAELRQDNKLTEMFKASLTDSCYPDLELRTLTIDVGFYISRNCSAKGTAATAENWIPTGYNPGLSADEWTKLLSDKHIFTDSSLAILKRMMDIGGEATCSQLAAKYGEAMNFYNSGSVALARRVAQKTGCPVSKREDGSIQWWAILYLGREAANEEPGSFVWKLREELSDALQQWDMQHIPLFAETAAEAEIRYWLYAPGRSAEKWDEFQRTSIMGLGWEEIGDLSAFASKEEMAEKMREVYGDEKRYTNSAYATWQFAHEIRPGDIVFVKRGRLGEILGRGIVKSGYEYDNARTEYNNIIPVEWTHKGEWKVEGEQFPMKTLTDITRYNELVEKIRSLFAEDVISDEEPPAIKYPPYTADDFLRDVYMSRENYDAIKAQMKKKKNIILQGAPGVGKTFVAKRLAYSLMGEEDKERVMMVQFHQSYSYEDFIMGLRPTESGGFLPRTGPFYNFCKKAEIDDGRSYFFIIDEINRGNLNKIFGELFMLLEADKRGEEIQLLYKDERFSVPGNLYLIGTMNTADRSLALLDYALRRRFSFFPMKPGFDTAGFRAYQESLENDKFNRLIAAVEKLNQYIKNDETLGEGFMIGHSYFCGLAPEEVDDVTLAGIVEYEILPLIGEYWFDEPSKLADRSEEIRSALR